MLGRLRITIAESSRKKSNWRYGVWFFSQNSCIYSNYFRIRRNGRRTPRPHKTPYQRDVLLLPWFYVLSVTSAMLYRRTNCRSPWSTPNRYSAVLWFFADCYTQVKNTSCSRIHMEIFSFAIMSEIVWSSWLAQRAQINQICHRKFDWGSLDDSTTTL